MPLRSERRYISLNNVQSGMMIQFNYKKKSGERGQYIVLVVDPNRTNERATEPQLHGFVIKELSDKELVDFFNSFETDVKLTSEDKREPVIKELNTDEAYSKFKSSKYIEDRSYRTFNLSSISQVRQILVGSVE